MGSRFANSRGILFAAVALLLFLGSIGLTVGTISFASVSLENIPHSELNYNQCLYLFRQTHGGMYILYVAFFVISACMLARSIYYFRLKVSAIDGPL